MLEQKGTLRYFKEGETIFNEGSYGEEMYVIKSGTVDIFRQRNGREAGIAKLGEKDFFGELAFFGNFPRSASARAETNCQIFMVDKDTFMKLINDNIVWLILKKLGDRIRKTDDKLEQLLIKDQVLKESLSTIVQRRQWT